MVSGGHTHSHTLLNTIYTFTRGRTTKTLTITRYGSKALTITACSSASHTVLVLVVRTSGAALHAQYLSFLGVAGGCAVRGARRRTWCDLGTISDAHRGHARGAQPKARCASGASGARPTQGFRKAPCGAPARFGIFEGDNPLNPTLTVWASWATMVAHRCKAASPAAPRAGCGRVARGAARQMP